MSELTLFGNKPNLALLDGIPDVAAELAGNGGTNNTSTNRRISIKGKNFRQIINGKEYNVVEDNSMNVVIVRAAAVSRMFFEGTYKEGEVVKPTCWSSDSRTPDESVPQDQKQANSCLNCNQNIKGSGAGNGRACRFQQRVAVMLEGAIDKREVYQLVLPPTSIFGEGTKDKMPMQAYGKYLQAHNTNPITIITEMKFDSASATPKLVFKPVRLLSEEEQRVVIEMLEHEDTLKAIKLNVSQMDKVLPAPEKPMLFAPKPEAKPEPVQEVVEEVVVEAQPEEVVEEPKKVVKKSAVPPPAEDVDLASIVDSWDD